jgi:hypothetical protein
MTSQRIRDPVKDRLQALKTLLGMCSLINQLLGIIYVLYD